MLFLASSKPVLAFSTVREGEPTYSHPGPAQGGSKLPHRRALCADRPERRLAVGVGRWYSSKPLADRKRILQAESIAPE
jgi:hypothetical protein